MSTATEQIRANFPAASDPAVESRVAQLLGRFTLSAEDLRFKWESFSLSNGGDVASFTDKIDEFQQFLQQEVENPRKKARVGTPNIVRSRVQVTPARQIQRVAAKPTTPTPVHTGPREIELGFGGTSSDIPSSPTKFHYAERLNQGKIIETLNPEISPAATSAANPGAPVRPAVFSNIKEYEYRTMYQKLPEMGLVFDTQIERMKTLLIESGTVGESEIGNPSRVVHENIVAVGRIAASNPDGRLELAGAVLEASRRSGGARMPLNFSQVSDINIFKGQIVAVRGKNPTGSEFIVTELLELPRMPMPLQTAEMKAAVEARGDQPVNMLIASGPFTFPDNLEFAPLRDFVAQIDAERPSAVVLFGPFLESTHPLLQGDVPNTRPEDTIDDIFVKMVAPILAEIDESIPVILVPSLRDATVAHAAFPQPSFAKKSLGIPKHFRCYPNPVAFSLDEMVFNATSADAVSELVRSPVRRATPSKLAPAPHLAFKHILRQRRLFPVYPATASTIEPRIDAKVSVDVAHLDLANIDDVAPHILVVPSARAHFAEIIDNVICINPGYLVRPRQAGTYARLTVANGSDPLWNRARVDIVNI